MRVASLCAALLVCLAGCIVPTEPSKQAEEISSIAAEGSLLAHDAAEGDTTETFTRVHADALLKNLDKLQPKVEVGVLRRLILDADRALEDLREAPGDRAGAGRVQRTLHKVSVVAEEYAG
jgi:hypothetical protein